MMNVRHSDVPLRVLLVEDQDDDAMLLVTALQQSEFEFVWQRASNADEYLKALETAPDVVLADDGVAGLDALQALRRLQEYGSSSPLIVLTGQVDERAMVECLKSGAADYLAKDRLPRLGPAILRAIADKKSELEKRCAESGLLERARLATLGAAVGVALTRNESIQGALQQCAEALVTQLGAAFARVWTVDEAGDMLELQASAGLYTHIDGPHGRVPVGMFKIGLIAQERQPLFTNNVLTDPRVGNPEWAKREGMVAFAGFPLIVEDRLVGVMAFFSRETLGDFTMNALGSVADEIALGIEHRRTVGALRESEERFRFMAEASGSALYRLRLDQTRYDYLSPAIEGPTGYTVAEINEIGFKNLIQEIVSTKGQELSPTSLHGQGETGSIDSFRADYLIRTKSGEQRWLADHCQPWRDRAGTPIGTVGLLIDVTVQRQLEEQLRQSQKMDVLGQLAGGVAHDFNNLLTVINGMGEVLLDDLPPDSPQREPLELILAAGESASGLTRQLLAFSRRQVLAPQDLDLNAVIEATTRMLRRLIGEDISLCTIYQPNLDVVRADPGQMEQILMNLAANARDAMPEGGTLTISMSHVTLTETDAALHPAAHPGAYAVLSVRDTGTGMDAATQARIFEPFFTTKGADKGTGLGLAAVFGIVTQQDGFIHVESARDQGTTIKIYLPRIGRPAAVREAASVRPKPPRGVETILLVDDETRLRRVAQLVLEGSGYTVLGAENGATALEIADTHAGRIDLVLTDVVMPGMNGRVLVEQLRPRLPNVKALFMSGYTDDVVFRNGVIDAEVALLQKPFTPLALAQKVRRVLDAS